MVGTIEETTTEVAEAGSTRAVTVAAVVAGTEVAEEEEEEAMAVALAAASTTPQAPGTRSVPAEGLGCCKSSVPLLLFFAEQEN